VYILSSLQWYRSFYIERQTSLIHLKIRYCIFFLNKYNTQEDQHFHLSLSQYINCIHSFLKILKSTQKPSFQRQWKYKKLFCTFLVAEKKRHSSLFIIESKYKEMILFITLKSGPFLCFHKYTFVLPTVVCFYSSCVKTHFLPAGLMHCSIKPAPFIPSNIRFMYI
jgi:hypothetical protein